MRYIILLFFAFLSFCSPAQKFDTLRQESQALTQLILKKHYNPPLLDDVFSEQLFNDFLHNIDFEGLIFTQIEIEQLSKYKQKLDNELSGESWEFVPLFAKLFHQSHLRAIRILEEYNKSAFNFSEDEYIQFSKIANVTFASDEIMLKKRWQKWLKYNILNAAFKQTANAEKAMLLEPKLRKKWVEKNLSFFKKLIDNKTQYKVAYISEIFLKTISQVFDPHTSYISALDKENEPQAHNVEIKTFGFRIDQNQEGNVFISELLPGGSAWKTNKLNKNDIILSIKTQEGLVYDASSYDVDSLEELLNNSKHLKIELTVQKSNHTTQIVELEKTTIRVEEDIVKGYILKGEKRIGYISLPGFYSDWDFASDTPHSCSNDVAMQIVKLKKEGIDGLILDVRNNGGGSMLEGLDLSGIFIDQGILSYVKYQNKKAIALKDRNRGTIYEGPMILMVNGASASASELLAGTLQDFNRALIVGSETYGKGSIQIQIPIDTLKLSNRPKYGFEMGELKTTIGRFFRPNGFSSQIKGIKPDIILPDFLNKTINKEKMSKNALSEDSVAIKTILGILPKLPINDLAQKSYARTQSNVFFTNIKKFEVDFDALPTKVNLNGNDFKAYYEQKDKLFQQFINNREVYKTAFYQAKNTQLALETVIIDDYTKEIDNFNMDNLNADVWLEEAYQIMLDMINE